MDALIINPWTRTVEAVEREAWMPPDLLVELALPGRSPARGMDAINLDTGDTLWVDDEVTRTAKVPCWTLQGHPGMLAGMGVVLGKYPDNPSVDVDHLLSLITFQPMVTTGCFAPAIPDPDGPGHVVTPGAPIFTPTNT